MRFLVHTDYSKRIHMHTHTGTHTHEHSDDYHYYYHFNSLEKTRCQAVRHAQVVQLLCTTFRQLDQQWGLLLGIFIQCSIGLLKDTQAPTVHFGLFHSLGPGIGTPACSHKQICPPLTLFRIAYLPLFVYV